MSDFRPTELVIHRELLRANLSQLKKRNRTEFFCPMIKADGYGHGANLMAQIAREEGCRFVGVALYEEAIALRQAGFSDLEILVFSPLSARTVKLSLDLNLTPVVCALSDLKILQEVLPKSAHLRVHLKINVGMNRLGFSMDLAAEAERTLRSIPGITLEGLCCHLPCAEDVDTKNTVTISQLEKFLAFAQGKNFRFLHALNSDALLKLSQLKHKFLEVLGARPGIALYGVGSSDLRPAMEVKSQIVHLQNLRAGESVSYGSRWTAQQKSVIGIVPVGYADGVRRGLSHDLSVLVQKTVIPVVGTICMDYIMIDVTGVHLDAAKIGNLEVSVMDLVQPGLTVADWSQKLQTIPYEVMVGLGSSRLRRVFA